MDKPVAECSTVLIGTLGSFRMSGEGGEFALPRSRKSRALLAALALEARPLSRERAADLLWSDRETEQARSSLRQALFEIRHADFRLEKLVLDGPHGLSLNATVAETDLHLLRAAADRDEWALVCSLLDASGPELLDDLNGLDSQFDEWLRGVRTAEPARTLASAVASGERCLDQASAHLAAEIASGVLRIDPTSEAGARLAMRAAGSVGDRSAVNRIYQQLRDQLAEHYSAAPSDETAQLLDRLNANSARGATSRPTPVVETAPSTPSHQPAVSEGRRHLGVPVAMVAAGLVGAAALTWVQQDWPGSGQSEPLVAVVPFEAVNRDDEALAEGLWDDTRSSLSRSGVVRVLGRTTSEAFSRARLTPADYLQKLDVDYLLDGGVRRQGDQVRVSVSLLRTSDGVAVWEHSFDGRLGNPIALQGAIASAIEGRVRGRLATGGGARATQIPTTPEVYDLYVQSKQLLRSRTGNKAQQASELLDRAIQRDPNFAPALALSGAALYFSSYNQNTDPRWRKLAQARTDRAIELAPRLGQAYAISALVSGLNSRASEEKLVKATQYDPGDAEAWLWLANARSYQGNWVGAEEGLWRSVTIDPYLAPALQNLAEILITRRDQRDFNRLIAKLRRADSSGMLADGLLSQRAYRRGEIAQGLKLLLPLLTRPAVPDHVKMQAANGVIMLGDWDAAGRIVDVPQSQIDYLVGRAQPDLRGAGREFFLGTASSTASMRAALLSGRSKEVVDAFRRNFQSADDFITTLSTHGEPDVYAPYLIAALQDVGDVSTAQQLAKVADTYSNRLHRAPEQDGNSMASRAKIRVLQGRRSEALKILSDLVSTGWLPDGLLAPTDIANDPIYRRLDGPQFQQIRRAILDHVARERQKLGPIKV